MKLKLAILVTLIVVVVMTWIALEKRAPRINIKVDTSTLKARDARLVEAQLATVRNSPRSAAAWGQLGALLKSYEFRDEALQCLTRAERLDPREARWPYLIGLMLATEAPDTAIAKLQRATELSSHPAVRLRLGKMLIEAGQLKAARRVLDEGVAHPPTRLMLAHVVRQLGEVEQAEKLARACTQDARTARAAWGLLAAMYLGAGKSEEAAESNQRAAQSPLLPEEGDPFEAETMAVRREARWLSDRAQEHLRAGRPEEARSLIAELAREHPDFAETWLLLGRTQLIEKQAVQAEETLRRHLTLEPDSIQGTFQLGRALQEQGKLAEATEVFGRTTKLKPDYGPAWFNLAICQAKLGRTADAIEASARAVRHNPEHVEGYLLLADLRAQAGDADAALDLLNQADALRPNDPRVRNLKRRIESGAANKDLK